MLLVLGFHAEIGILRGGFTGVDIFFVISGFLISGIILRGLDANTFTFAEFYARRALRILPALVVVLASTLLAAWFVAFASESKSLGKHVIGGSLFVSNFFFWQETGYFNSQAKPLLHLWSLGVEEQFYFLWPLAIFLTYRRGFSISALLVALISISFGANILAIASGQASFAFFSPVTRFWEILVGGLVWLRSADAGPFGGAQTDSRIRDVFAIVGGLLILLALCVVNRNTAWPGWYALLPVAGTSLLLWSGSGTWIARLLGSRALVGIGLISYPLYLWHWPLFVFGRILYGGQVPRFGRVLIALLSILLAWATYRFVERSIRFGTRPRRNAVRLVISLALCGVVGALFTTGVIRPRLDVALAEVADAARMDGTYPGGEFTANGDVTLNAIPGDTSRTIAFFGDSHMEQYWPRVLKLSAQKGPNLPRSVFITKVSCPPLPDVNGRGVSPDGKIYRCDTFFRRALVKLRDPQIKVVVITGWWEEYLMPGANLYLTRDFGLPDDPLSFDNAETDTAFSLLEKVVADLVSRKKKVVLLTSNPFSSVFHPDSLLLPKRLTFLPEKQRRTSIRKHEAVEATANVRKRLVAIAMRTGAVVVDPVEYLCDTVCPALLNGVPIYRDANHLRASYVEKNGLFVDSILKH